MSHVTHAFLHLTTFETGTSVQCFTKLIGKLAGHCRRLHGDFINTTGIHRFASAKRVLALQTPGTRFNCLFVRLQSLQLPPPFHLSELTIAKILWTPRVYCWDRLEDADPGAFPIFNLRDDPAGLKLTKELWEAERYIAREQNVVSRKPSICTLLMQLGMPVESGAAYDGLRALAEMLGADPLPEDLRIYGNFGDQDADGITNLSLSACGEPPQKVTSRFLRPKPLLGARRAELDSISSARGVVPLPLNLYTASGDQLATIRLTEGHLAGIAAGLEAESFLHLTPFD